MKITAILGSPHGRKGNTGKLLDSVLDAARGEGVEAEQVSLVGLDIRPCRGCDVCHRAGECAIKDDFAVVRDAVLASDAVILASPNYIFNVTAQMKAFLDRCCGLVHLLGLEGKYGAAVVTSGGGGGDEVEAYLLRFLRAVGARGVGSVGALTAQMANGPQRADRLAAAAALGRDLVSAVREKREYPAEEPDRSAFFRRMRALIESRADEWTYEYEYWKSQGRI